MRNLMLFFAAIISVGCVPPGFAQDVTLIAPTSMRCALTQLAPDVEKKTGHALKMTTGVGGAMRQRVVHGDAFDVSIVQAPLEDVLASGNVVASSETPLAIVSVALLMRKGSPKPDISTPEALKQTLLAAKSITYGGAAGPAGGAAAAFDDVLKKLGIYDEMQSKVKHVPGSGPLKLVADGVVDYAVLFTSEADDPAVEVVGVIPESLTPPARMVGFVSTHASAADAAQAVLKYLASTDAAAAYKACEMQPGH